MRLRCWVAGIMTMVMSACSGDQIDLGPGRGGTGGNTGAQGGSGESAGETGSGGAGGSAPSPLEGDPAKVADFCAALDDAIVQSATRCGGGVAEMYRGLFDCGRWIKAAQVGRIGFDAEKAAECLEHVGGSCDAYLWYRDEACRLALSGRVPIGGACHALDALLLGYDCAPEAYCEFGDLDRGAYDVCTGVCVPYAKLGERCSHLRCAPGLTCQSDEAAPLGPDGYICGPRAAENEVCGFIPRADGLEPLMPVLCEPDLYCDQASTPNICRPPKTAGLLCSGSGQCAEGYYCPIFDAASAVCTRATMAGETCTPGSAECVVGYCSADRTCAVVAREGEPCGYIWEELRDASPAVYPVDWAHCEPGLVCVVLSVGETPRDGMTWERGICRHPVQPGNACPAFDDSTPPTTLCADVGSQFGYCNQGQCALCD